MNPAEEAESPCVTPNELMSRHSIPSGEPEEMKALVDASQLSSASLQTAGEDVSQNTFFTAQQSISSTLLSENKPSTDLQNDRSVKESGDRISASENSMKPLPAIFNAMALEQIQQFREELSCALGSKDRLELIFGVSSHGLQSPEPERVEEDIDLTDAAVASIPFVDTVQAVDDLPEADVTCDKIPGIVYLPSSSTFGENSLQGRGHMEPIFVASDDENSTLGSDESCFIEMDAAPTTDADIETTVKAGDVDTVSNGTVLASMISAALEEHAASLDRIRLQYSVDADCPCKVTMDEPQKENHAVAPYDEPQDDAPANVDLVKDPVPEEQDISDTEVVVLNTAGDVKFSAYDGYSLQGPHEQVVNLSSPQSPVALLPCELEECSHLQGTENSSEADTETFQTAAQSSWEQEMFGLSVSEVKADLMLVLEEVAGVTPLNTSTDTYNESNYKMCGGCSWLARLRCW